jgi:Uma2 family endonuclease
MATVSVPETTGLTPEANGDVLYEVVDGQYVELPPMSSRAVRVATVLSTELENHGRAQRLGQAATEMLFGLGPRLRRRPDVGFVSFERWPEDRELPETDPWPVVPNLAVEVVSPNDLAQELLRKIEEYFQAGVQLVWVVYLQPRVVHVYESFTQIRVLTPADTLAGGSVLPGFQLPLTILFKQPNP